MNRYVILDASTVMVNRIATDAEVIIYAGYGKYVAYEGDGDIPAVTTEEPWVYLSVKPDAPMAQGDIMNINTGHVTRPEPPPEEVVEGLA